MIRALAIPVSLCFLATIACSRSAEYYVERGMKLSSDGKLEDASIEYRKALTKDPNFGQAYYQLGLLYIRQKNLRDAYYSLARAVELMPSSEDVKIKLAEVCFEEYLFNHSLTALYQRVAETSEQLLSKDPNSFDGLRLKGNLALSDKKIEDAVRYLERANRVKPMDPDVILALTQALIFANQSEAGEKLAAGFIQKEPTFGPIYDVLYNHYLRTNRPADADRILKAKVESAPKEAAYILQLANHYYRLQKPAETANALQRLLDNSKDFPNAHLLVGDFYAQKGKWEEAIAQYEAGIRSSRGDALLCEKRIVRAELAQGKRSEAMQAVEQILKNHPKDQESRGVRARLLLENGRPEDVSQALREFQALLKENPEDPELHYDLALVRLAQGDPTAARMELLEAIKRKNDYIPPRLLLAGMSLKQRKWDDALRYSDEVLRMDSRNTQAALFHASALTSMGNYDAARAELTKLTNQFPQFRPAQVQLGVLAIAQKKYKEAEEIYAKLRQDGAGNLSSTAGLVATYSSENRFEEASKVLQDALRKSPDSAPLQALMADVAAGQGQLDRALSYYQQLAARFPKSVEVRMRMGDIYERKGDWDNAIAMFQQAIRLAPNHAVAESKLAGALVRVGRSGEARSLYEQLLRQRPDDPNVQNSLAFILTETGGNLDEAQRLVEQALQKVPGQPHFADTLGFVYLKKQMAGSAVQIFQKLVSQDAGNPTFRYHLGMALFEAGDMTGAESELNRALHLQPSTVQQQQITGLIAKLK